MSRGDNLITSDEDFLRQDFTITEDAGAVDGEADQSGTDDEDEEESDSSLSSDNTDAGTENAGGTDGDDPSGDPAGQPDGEDADDGEDGEADDADKSGQSDDGSDDPSGEGDEEQEEESGDSPSGSQPKDKAEGPEGKDAEAGDLKDPKDGKDAKDTKEQNEPAEGGDSTFQVPKSFRANGKVITLKDASEAEALMQMGANYTYKMQQLKPAREIVAMLERHDLADTEKLSFAIDLMNGDEKAVQKFLKDKNIDPLSIDTESESDYVQTDHSVSSAEVTFQDAVTDMRGKDGGEKLLRTIYDTWDPQSKQALVESPQILDIIYQQRTSGVYDVVTQEIERMKTLGQMDPSTPFIQAYQTAGDALVKNGTINDQGGDGSEVQTDPEAEKAGQPSNREENGTTSRAPKPKRKVQNGDKAKAAGMTRSVRTAPSKSKLIPEKDDAFLAQFENRV